MLNDEDQQKITMLLSQIDRIRKEAAARPSNMLCDICGKGDHQAKNAILRVRNDAAGYFDRLHESPTLCFRHYSGWSNSYNRFVAYGDKTDEEIDLHFAMYLANHLMKAKNHEQNP